MTKHRLSTRACLFIFAAFLGGGFSTAFAQIYSTTISGVSTWNGFSPVEFTTEFPVGTAWTAHVSWDTAAAPLATYPTQAQFRLIDFSLTFHGQSGDFTTSALANKGSFGVTNHSGNTYHSMQFTTEWGPGNLTTGSTLGVDFYSINISFGGNYSNGIAALDSPPDSLNLDLYDLGNTSATQLKIYLNNMGSSQLLGSISATPAAVPEPSTYAGLAGLGALAFCVLRRRTRRPN